MPVDCGDLPTQNFDPQSTPPSISPSGISCSLQNSHTQWDTSCNGNCSGLWRSPHSILIHPRTLNLTPQAKRVSSSSLCWTRAFEISALSCCTLSTENATDFLEVYKGVVPEYESMVLLDISRGGGEFSRIFRPLYIKEDGLCNFSCLTGQAGLKLGLLLHHHPKYLSISKNALKPWLTGVTSDRWVRCMANSGGGFG